MSVITRPVFHPPVGLSRPPAVPAFPKARAIRLARYAAHSIALAAFLWLLLATPAFLTD